eukprot:TRINITY_DN8978_c0_g2_i1.p1 TRINITY_DN8978_c0_g2~~TRINITY_DN8978_c0_g2_i1.p1  ORF type:complete len:1061 (+),score=245.94 TRINITY_DN8978_c0_g2_i1:84-3185(+)
MAPPRRRAAAAVLLCSFGAARAATLPSGTLAECKAIASLFRNTCSSAPDSPASSVGAMTSSPVSCDNVGMCAGTTSGSTCTWQRKLCVSCSESGGTVRIRVQTNGLPDHCYTSPRVTPTSNDIDWSTVFAPGIDPDVPASSTTNAQTQDEVNDLLCDIGRTRDSPPARSQMPSASAFMSHGTTGTNTLAATAINGVSMFNQMSVELVDPFYPQTWSSATTTVSSYQDAPEKVDKCLAHPQANGVFHYHVLPPCLYSTTIAAEGNQPLRNDDAKTRALQGYSGSDGLRVIGIAKDGNVVFGPYNADGTLITGVDVCNGRHLTFSNIAGGGTHYSYVATSTFPYFVGCFGPGSRPSFTPTCTSNPISAYTAAGPPPSGPPPGPVPQPATPTPPTPPQTPPASGGNKPNILLVNPDDMVPGYGNWGIAPDSPPGMDIPMATGKTPNMDKIKNEGVTFSRFYGASGMCAPSRFAIVTGRYPSRGENAVKNTIRTQGADSDTKVTVPVSMLAGVDMGYNLQSALKKCGYRTGHVGKWHLTLADEGGSYHEPYTTQQKAVTDRGMDYADGLFIENLDSTCGATCGFNHNMEWTTERALHFMKEAVTAGEPFFMYLNPTPPHSPLMKDVLPTTTYPDTKTPKGDIASPGAALGGYCPTCSLKGRQDVWDETARTWAGQDRSFVAAVIWIDSAVGALYNWLAAENQLDKTVFIVTSDNGHAKGTVYEQGTRLPLFIRYPPLFPAGAVRSPVVSHVDLAPTLLELAGYGGSYDTDGLSLVKVAKGEEASPNGRTEIFLEMEFDRAVVSDRYKLITQNSNSVAKSGVTNYYPAWNVATQLYDLSTDEAEQKNLAGQGNPAEAQLKAKLDAHKSRTKDSVTAGGTLDCGSAPGPAPAPVPPVTSAPVEPPTKSPSAFPTASPTGSPTVSPPPPQAPACGCAVPASRYSRCGGRRYTGCTCCEAGFVCKLQTRAYSQCVPDSAWMSAAASREGSGGDSGDSATMTAVAAIIGAVAGMGAGACAVMAVLNRRQRPTASDRLTIPMR